MLCTCFITQIFKPPNPWIMGIMSVLAELHAVPDLKVTGMSVLTYMYQGVLLLSLKYIS